MDKQPTVLVIEENSTLLDTFSLILKKRGYNVETAKEADAVNKSDKPRFDVILMDVMQQGINDIETLYKIKQLAPGARVILLAPQYYGTELQNVLMEQAFETVYKPVDIGQLMALIKMAVEKKPSSDNHDKSSYIDQ